MSSSNYAKAANTDADSISLLYTQDGNLGDIAIGRDSIRKFLSSFKNIRVLSQVSTTKSISITHDTAYRKGFILNQIFCQKNFGNWIHVPMPKYF